MLGACPVCRILLLITASVKHHKYLLNDLKHHKHVMHLLKHHKHVTRAASLLRSGRRTRRPALSLVVVAAAPRRRRRRQQPAAAAAITIESIEFLGDGGISCGFRTDCAHWYSRAAIVFWPRSHRNDIKAKMPEAHEERKRKRSGFVQLPWYRTN